MPKIQAFHSTLHQNRQSELHHSMEPVLQIHHPTWTFPEAVPADTSVFIYIQIMLFGHFNHCIDHGTGVSSFRCIAEQPVTASNRKRSDCIFAEVIGKTAPSILEIGHEFSLVVLGSLDRCQTPVSQLFLQINLNSVIYYFGSVLCTLVIITHTCQFF